MARSILPSTTGYASRLRPLIHRFERHRANAAVRAMLKDPGLWDEGADEPDAMQREIGPMVRSRRGDDKLNHFERWAVERTREMPAAERLGHLAGLLPPGLIGEHALSHLERNPALMTEEQQQIWFARRNWGRARPMSLDRGEAAVLLRQLLAVHNGHRFFNRALKYTPINVVTGMGPKRLHLPARAGRLLYGLHDVLPFLAHAWRVAPLVQIADRFLRRFKATRDPEAALAAVGIVQLSWAEHLRLLRS